MEPDQLNPGAQLSRGGSDTSPEGRKFTRPYRTYPYNQPFSFACPRCRTSLERSGEDEYICPLDGELYRKVAGVWRFLTPERQRYYEQFIREYETVRRAEGRGSEDPAYYRALPFADLTGRLRPDWKIRAQSFRALLRWILKPMERPERLPLTILDLGAGNSWLANRLAQRGHRVAAVDLSTDRLDGLGACIHYEAPFISIQADFDHLPFTDRQVDLAIFNASFHYSTGYEQTMGEALRVLRPQGLVVLLDSPLYRDPASGEQMVREREALFTQKHGFPSNAISSQNYLTCERLESLAARLGLDWKFYRPDYGLRWALRPWMARLLGRREPASFLLIAGRRAGQ